LTVGAPDCAKCPTRRRNANARCERHYEPMIVKRNVRPAFAAGADSSEVFALFCTASDQPEAPTNTLADPKLTKALDVQAKIQERPPPRQSKVECEGRGVIDLHSVEKAPLPPTIVCLFEDRASPCQGERRLVTPGFISSLGAFSTTYHV